MKITQQSKLQNLWQKAKAVRAHHADKVQGLAVERGKFESRHREAYQKSEDYQDQADAMKVAQRSLKIASKAWSAGQLGELQEAALELARNTAGNPFAALGLSTLHGVSKALGGNPSEETLALQGAVAIAGAIGDEPKESRETVNKVLQDNFYGLPKEDFVSSVSPKGLSRAADKMAGSIDTSEFLAEELGKAAQSAWSDVTATQEKLQAQFKMKRNKESFAQRKAAAQDFLSDLEAESQINSNVAKDMQDFARGNQQDATPWIQPTSLLTSYKAQLKRHGGDLKKLDWKKLVNQFERTSFG